MTVCSAKRPEQAHTLIELLVAICILGITAGGVINGINYGLFMMGVARENQRATQILLEKTETIRLYNWSEVSSNGFIPATFTNVYEIGRASWRERV